MPQTKTFISHSTNDDQTGRAFLDRLLQALGDQGFSHVVDFKNLERGTRWHQNINFWLFRCDAALVLLTEKALESDYVGYEVANLSARESVFQDEFLLLPIFLGIRPNEIKQKPLFRASQLERLHSFTITLDETTWDEKINAIVQRMASFSGRHEVESRDSQLREITKLLTRFPKRRLQDAMEKLDKEIEARGTSTCREQDADEQHRFLSGGDWLNRGSEIETLANRLANRLVIHDMNSSLDALQELYAEPGSDERIDCILQLVACRWVSPSEVATIHRAAKDADRRGLVIEAREALVTEHYLLRASDTSPRNAWKSCSISQPGEFDTESLKTKILENLAETLKGIPPDKVPSFIRVLNERKQPVFLILKDMDAGLFDTLDRENLAQLGATLLYMTERWEGNEELDSLSVTPEFEEDLYTQYMTCQISLSKDDE